MVADGDLRAGEADADRVEADVVVPVHDGDAADLRLPVDLLEVDADRMEEAEHVRTERGSAGIGVAEA